VPPQLQPGTGSAFSAATSQVEVAERIERRRALPNFIIIFQYNKHKLKAPASRKYSASQRAAVLASLPTAVMALQRSIYDSFFKGL